MSAIPLKHYSLWTHWLFSNTWWESPFHKKISQKVYFVKKILKNENKPFFFSFSRKNQSYLFTSSQSALGFQDLYWFRIAEITVRNQGAVVAMKAGILWRRYSNKDMMDSRFIASLQSHCVCVCWVCDWWKYLDHCCYCCCDEFECAEVNKHNLNTMSKKTKWKNQCVNTSDCIFVDFAGGEGS